METIIDLETRFPGLTERVDDDTKSIYHIWKSAWGTARQLFAMENDHPILRIVTAPQHMGRIIVRSEYVQAYNDARRVYTNLARGTEVVVEHFETPDDPATFTLEDACAKLYDDDPYPAVAPPRHIVTIGGQPGIGKSNFLWYILVRRLALRKMVIYQDTPDSFYIFHQDGVTRVNLSTNDIHPQQLTAVLPFSTWILVDSNDSLNVPPRTIIKLRRFMIHAASSNAVKTRWWEKTGFTHSTYIMKPMSLEEIEQCLYCLEPPRRTVEDIRDFHTRYGPSAWGALFGSSEWESMVNQALHGLADDPNLLSQIISDLNSAVDAHSEISSRIFLLRPGKMRHIAQVEVATDHIFKMLLDWLYSTRGSHMEAGVLRRLQSGPPAAQSIASGLLEMMVDSI